MNKVFLIGNLTKDPELSTTSGGINYCRFTLAVPKRFVGNSDRNADFINIIVWRVQAENCHKYLRKGSKAGVCGSIQTRNYNAPDGTKRYVTEVVADEVEFLSTRMNNAESNSNASVTTQPKPASGTDTSGTAELQPVDDDSLPF